MARVRLSLAEKVPLGPRKLVVYTDNLMTARTASIAATEDIPTDLAYSLVDTLTSALVLSTSLRFDPELNVLEVLDPNNQRNNILASGIINFKVSVKLYLLSGAADTNNRPASLYVRQALACIQKQLGSVKIEELLVSFIDTSIAANPPAKEPSIVEIYHQPHRTQTGDIQKLSLGFPHDNDQLTTNNRNLELNGFIAKDGFNSSSAYNYSYSDLLENNNSTSSSTDATLSILKNTPYSSGTSSPGNGKDSGYGCNGNSTPSGSDVDVTRYLKVWRTLNRSKASGEIGRLGLCDLTQPQLQKLIEYSRLKPDVLQVNANSDFDINGNLLNYAREQNISMRMHTDCAQVLTESTFQDLIDHFRISERFPTTEVSAGGAKADHMRPRWVASYSVSLRNRGLVDSRGYIVMGSSDSVLDPNCTPSPVSTG